MYKLFIKPIFFLFNPETIHSIVFFYLKIPGIKYLLKLLYGYSNKKLEQDVFGLHFKNPVGLAAGLDKDSEVFNSLGACGFSFVEVGTITPKAQAGNPKPRLFRLKKNNALINRMGFNNKGVEYSIKKIKQKKNNKNIIIGANIGKNKITPNNEAEKDYEICYTALYNYVDYFVVNVSSPNTPNLRELQSKKQLTKLLLKLTEIRETKKVKKPLLLKIAPDLTNEQLDDIIAVVEDTKIDGIVATNTTIARDNLNYTQEEIDNFGNGGLSGQPVKKRSTEVIKYLSDKSNKKITIIGVGGIENAEDAIEKLEAGASLIQLYTSFIYEGPGVVKKINKEIIKINKTKT